MKYKEQVIKHTEFIEDGLNILLKDIQANRLNSQSLENSLKGLINKVEHLSNLIELED
tara:strand:+ start:654 stop:827 length:174 start_codon:yes stop_codon:yes gene_type:complete